MGLAAHPHGVGVQRCMRTPETLAAQVGDGLRLTQARNTDCKSRQEQVRLQALTCLAAQLLHDAQHLQVAQGGIRW